MRTMNLSLLLISVIWLSACIPPSGQLFGEQVEYLRNDSGNVVIECASQTDWTTGKIVVKGVQKDWAKEFWTKNNLPKGTLYYVCDGNKAVLPKDCNGNSLTTPEIRKYWKKYNLPIGTEKFDCSSGVPKVPKGSWFENIDPITGELIRK